MRGLARRPPTLARSAKGLLATGTIGLIFSLIVSACFEPRRYPGPPLCSSVAECDDKTVCTIDACVDGTCVHEVSAAKGPDDKNACTEDLCTDGVESHEPVTKVGAECGTNSTLTCDTSGRCAECFSADSCGNAEPCRTWKCQGSLCIAVATSKGASCGEKLGICDGRGYCARCDDELQNAGETDIDCGGRCASLGAAYLCAAGMHCDSGTDCATGTCVDGLCATP